MKPYVEKQKPQPKSPESDAAETPELPDLELEDPMQKDVEGFDPYNTGIFKIDTNNGPWSKKNR